MKLEEGRTYAFKRLKIIELSDGEGNVMVEGPDRKKYLIRLDYYPGYHLAELHEIMCKVDKINCTGKVFLEPEHPHYREGESYLFNVRSHVRHTITAGSRHEYVFVADINGRLHKAPAGLFNDSPAPGNHVNLRIVRISKGKIYFTPKPVRQSKSG